MNGKNVIWKTPSFTADGLKIFACLVTLLSTAGVAIVQNGIIHLEQYTQESFSAALETDAQLMTWAGIASVLQLLGGLAVPLFALLVVEGVRHTSDLKRYALTVGIFALISEIPYDLAMGGKLLDWSSQNAMMTTTVCILMTAILEMMKKTEGMKGSLMRGMIVFCALIWVTLLRSEYGFSMVLICAVFELFYAKPMMKMLLGMAVSLVDVLGPLAFYGVWCYNEERKDRLPKYAYYIFYPAHLLVLGLIAKMMQAV